MALAGGTAVSEELNKQEEATHRVISRMQALGIAAKSAFDGIGDSIQRAILQTDSWRDAAQRVLRLILFSGLEAFLRPTTLGSIFGGIQNRIVPGRASGGPVTAGQRYRVGERGPEDFIPRIDGYIDPMPMAAGGMVIEAGAIQIQGYEQDPRALAAEVVSAVESRLARKQRGMALRSRDG